jgi:hypothetical protein
MGLDIRLPLGMIFVITGVILIAYGAFTWGSPIYTQSDGLNLNMIWGGVMVIFGAGMWIAGRRGKAEV